MKISNYASLNLKLLVECRTFRMRGHEEASGTKYIPQHLFEEWAKKDPIVTFENELLKQGIISEKDKEAIAVISNLAKRNLKSSFQRFLIALRFIN